MLSIGVRELRQHASRWLERVKAGESITVTDRGRPVARLVPVGDRGLQQLIDDGLARPGEGDGDVIARLKAEGGPTKGDPLSDRVADLRADER